MAPTIKDSLMREMRHRIPPQAVPRGFLATYMLSMISHGNQNGYSIMQGINEKSKGEWRPGPGTIYPMLKALSKEGLIEPLNRAGKSGDRSSTNYSITEKGKLQLDEWRKFITEQRTTDYGMLAILRELFSPSGIITFYMEHMPMEYEVLFEKITQLSPSEKEKAFKNMKELMETQMSRLDSILKKKR
jgi:DNA-binding PadR family transcriptional regulator